MKLVAFSVATAVGPLARLGALSDDDRVVDLNLAYRLMRRDGGMAPEAAARLADALVPARTVAFVAGGADTLEAAGEAADWAAARGAGSGPDGEVIAHELDGLRLLPAVAEPPVLRDFMGFESHLRNIYPRLGRQIPDEWYQLPVYYKGNPASVGAHGQDVVLPAYADELDFEFEFAAVIGRPGADIPREAAAGHIYGYTVYNDFSARGIQAREMAVGLGPAKGKDFRGAHVLGPWLVTADEIADVYDLAMRARVNGELWVESSTATMHWRFEDMIAHASRDEPLRPGEVFGSGTVGGGSGAERGQGFGPGDDFELTVQGLGTLRNRIVAADREARA